MIPFCILWMNCNDVSTLLRLTTCFIMTFIDINENRRQKASISNWEAVQLGRWEIQCFWTLLYSKVRRFLLSLFFSYGDVIDTIKYYIVQYYVLGSCTTLLWLEVHVIFIESPNRPLSPSYYLYCILHLILNWPNSIYSAKYHRVICNLVPVWHLII